MGLKTVLNKIFSNMNTSMNDTNLPKPYNYEVLHHWEKKWFKRHTDLKKIKVILASQTTLKGTKNALKMIRKTTDDKITKLVIEYLIDELNTIKQLRQFANMSNEIDQKIKEQSKKVFGDFDNLDEQAKFIKHHLLVDLYDDLQDLLGAKKYRKNPYLNHWSVALNYLMQLDNKTLLSLLVNDGAFNALKAKCFPEGYKVESQVGITFEYMSDLEAFINRPNRNIEAELSIIWAHLNLMHWFNQFFSTDSYEQDWVFNVEQQIGMDSELIDFMEDLYPTENTYKRAFFKFNEMRDAFSHDSHLKATSEDTSTSYYMELWRQTSTFEANDDDEVLKQIQSNMDVGFNLLLGGILEELADFKEGDADE